jgi:diaminopimelate epimerase
MENELWNKLEMFVGTGLVNMAVPHYVNEIKEQLTTEQLEPLGDLTEMLTNMFSVKSEVTARQSVEHLIHLAKLGVVKQKT